MNEIERSKNKIKQQQQQQRLRREMFLRIFHLFIGALCLDIVSCCAYYMHWCIVVIRLFQFNWRKRVYFDLQYVLNIVHLVQYMPLMQVDVEQCMILRMLDAFPEIREQNKYTKKHLKFFLTLLQTLNSLFGLHQAELYDKICLLVVYFHPRPFHQFDLLS